MRFHPASNASSRAVSSHFPCPHRDWQMRTWTDKNTLKAEFDGLITLITRIFQQYEITLHPHLGIGSPEPDARPDWSHVHPAHFGALNFCFETMRSAAPIATTPVARASVGNILASNASATIVASASIAGLCDDAPGTGGPNGANSKLSYAHTCRALECKGQSDEQILG